MTLTAGHLRRLRALALGRLGIEMEDRHAAVLDRRACRLGLEGAADREAFLARAESGDPDSHRLLVTLVTTGHTTFFRHPYHFDLAAEHLLWSAHQRGRAAAWSAAVSTGEELWSLAIRLTEMPGWRAGTVRLLGSDANASALARAAEGEYGQAAVESLTPDRRAAHCERPEVRRDVLRIRKDLRGDVSFRVQNLVHPVWPAEEPFDVIFCRNVLMYLSPSHRRQVVERLHGALAPDGLLLLDPSESLGAAEHRFQGGHGGVFRPVRPPGHPPPRRHSP